MWLDSAADRLGSVVRPVTRVLNAFGTSLALVMILVVAFNVISRGLFNKPFVGTVELEEIMLVLLVFFGIAYTHAQKRHISVDFVTGRFSERLQNFFGTVTSFGCTILFFVMSWQSLVLSGTYYQKGVASLSMQIPLFPVLWVIALGFFLIGLVCTEDFLRGMSRAVADGLAVPGITSLLLVIAVSLLPIAADRLDFFLDLRPAQILGVCALLAALFSGMLIGAGLAAVGALGMAVLFGPSAGMGLLQTVPISNVASYSLCVIPFFILMGEICFHIGLSEKLYRAAYKWVGQFRGGLSIATIMACGAFSAVSGSSLATSATMGTVALPEMKRYGYATSLATGSIAAGGTIGILIPPSVILIIYGVLVEESIAELFFAGIIPGLISILFYIVAIMIYTRIYPASAPPGPRATTKDRVSSLKDTWEVGVLFLLIMGGIYGGFFTPTEAGAIGAVCALLSGVIRGKINRTNLVDSLLATGRTTSMVFMVVIGTAIFGYFLTSTRLPMELAAFVTGLDVPRVVIMAAIIAACFMLGCVMGTLPLVFITVPIFAPVVETLGYDLIWFGIVMVVVSEVGLITPPVGMNVYIMKGVAGDVPLSVIFRGVVPFLMADVARLTAIIAFPAMSLWLPQLLR